MGGISDVISAVLSAQHVWLKCVSSGGTEMLICSVINGLKHTMWGGRSNRFILCMDNARWTDIQCIGSACHIIIKKFIMAELTVSQCMRIPSKCSRNAGSLYISSEYATRAWAEIVKCMGTTISCTARYRFNRFQRLIS